MYETYSKIIEHLKHVVKTSKDKRFIPYYAEYLTAFQLSKLGYEVQVLKKRRGPDLLVYDVNRNIKRLVEVKSSHLDLEGWDCAASFSKGTSIKKGEFDSCVFVVFENLEPKEYLVFTLDELREVATKERPYPITAFPNNPCALFRYKSFQEYEKAFPNAKDRLEIEIKLHKHPEEFRNRWDKIFL